MYRNVEKELASAKLGRSALIVVTVMPHPRFIFLVAMAIGYLSSFSAVACGGVENIAFRNPDDGYRFTKALIAESGKFPGEVDSAADIFFSAVPGNQREMTVTSVKVSMLRQSDGSWNASIFRSKGPIGQQAKEDYLAGAPLSFEYETVRLTEQNCPEIGEVPGSLREKFAANEARKLAAKQGEDEGGWCTCSDMFYRIHSKKDPELSLSEDNSCGTLYGGWIENTIAAINRCIDSAAEAAAPQPRRD
jgi:hypothetical protein